MTGIQPKRWVERASAAVEFYKAAFGATVLHRAGEGDDIVVQLAVGDAALIDGCVAGHETLQPRVDRWCDPP